MAFALEWKAVIVEYNKEGEKKKKLVEVGGTKKNPLLCDRPSKHEFGFDLGNPFDHRKLSLARIKSSGGKKGVHFFLVVFFRILVALQNVFQLHCRDALGLGWHRDGEPGRDVTQK